MSDHLRAKSEYRILVVDDDQDSQEIMSSVLQWDGYDVQTASSGHDAIEKMRDWDPCVVLLDMNMPGLSGIDTLRQLHKKEHYVSVMFVSGRSGTEDIIQGLDAGADDYICKPFDATELLARVRTQLRIVDLTHQLVAANKKLKQLVDTDDLTGLFNMRSLYQKLDFELERGRRYKRSVVALMMDLDDFKNVNDNNDHLFGSYVLSEVGKIIKENIRSVDFAARYGGEEFLIILTEPTLEGARAFSQRLGQCIAEYDFRQDDSFIQLTTSIGFAITDPKNCELDGRALVRSADRALYDAKKKGKNCFFYNDLAESGTADPSLMKTINARTWRKS